PEDREIAVNLGFLYAMEILRLDELSMGARPSDSGPDLSGHAKDELAASSNAVVLAAAGTALPNLAKAALNPAIFELASRLAAGARQLAPGDPDIQGPMPLIRYFKLATGQALPPPHKIVRPK
ncbi:MAG TPA: hypothetical protein VFW83_08215, partial [Bryobacteraceae bacterium]|nr:hypothetical protein [Bryobacteraceae bacterium]